MCFYKVYIMGIEKKKTENSFKYNAKMELCHL